MIQEELRLSPSYFLHRKAELRVQRGQESKSFRTDERKYHEQLTPTTFIEPPLNIQQSANHHMCVRKALKVQPKVILKDYRNEYLALTKGCECACATAMEIHNFGGLSKELRSVSRRE